MAPESQGDRPKPPPDYKVYKSRRGLGLSKPELGSLKDKVRPKAGSGRPSGPRPVKQTGGGRPWLKWIGLAVFGWLVLSFVAFAVSATIQKTKLADTEGTLGGNPLLVASPQNILVLGTDVRSDDFGGSAEAESEECLDQAASGETPTACSGGVRADTLMVLRAGGGAFEKLSIPRDTQAAIPGVGTGKINSAYASGGAALQIETVEDFLGIDINHIAIVDFNGFSDLIDSVGGVEVELENKVCNSISGGAFKIKLGPGKETLNGEKALALARTRTSTCGDTTIDDTDRARFQQLIIQGMKDRLTSPTRIPINFLKGPLIGWNAPKAFISDMGPLAMPQFVLAAAIGGDSEDLVLEPTGASGGNLIVPVENCIEAVRKLTGDPPENDPVCSPPG